MEIPLDGSDKFGRELVETMIIKDINQAIKDGKIKGTQLNKKWPVVNNETTPRGITRKKLEDQWDIEDFITNLPRTHQVED